MKDRKKSVEAGKKDAEQFIKNELIDYDPFIAISDLHLVRKTMPISFDSFKQTVDDMDPQLWSSIERSAGKIAAGCQGSFDFDGYAEGFSEGVAAVWDKIRGKVL
jgi:hypothetical protein